jgi:hypothetical protein
VDNLVKGSATFATFWLDHEDFVHILAARQQISGSNISLTDYYQGFVYMLCYNRAVLTTDVQISPDTSDCQPDPQSSVYCTTCPYDGS